MSPAPPQKPIEMPIYFLISYETGFDWEWHTQTEGYSSRIQFEMRLKELETRHVRDVRTREVQPSPPDPLDELLIWVDKHKTRPNLDSDIFVWVIDLVEKIKSLQRGETG